MSEYNKVEFGEGTFEGAEAGQEVEFSGVGTIVQKEDGTLCVEVNAVNDVPVVATMEPQAEEEMEEGEAIVQAKDSSKNLVSKLKEMNTGKENMYS